MQHRFALACVLAGALSIATAGPVRAAVVTGGAGGFPPSLYPSPASFPPWGLPNGCASAVGLQRPPATPSPALLTLLSRFGARSEVADLRLSDRALWPLVFETWRHARAPLRAIALMPANVSVQPGGRSPFAGLIAHNCGQRLLDDSVAISVCRSGPLRSCIRHAEGLIETFFVLQRRGRLLIWWIYP